MFEILVHVIVRLLNISYMKSNASATAYDEIIDALEKLYMLLF